MNLKNLILGLVAFTFAIGSAFVSAGLSGTIYVKAYLTQADFEEEIVSCVNTGETCENRVAPGVRCSVQLITQTSGYYATSNTFQESFCVVPILETTPTLAVSSITVYSVIENE